MDKLRHVTDALIMKAQAIMLRTAAQGTPISGVNCCNAVTEEDREEAYNILRQAGEDGTSVPIALDGILANYESRANTTGLSETEIAQYILFLTAKQMVKDYSHLNLYPFSLN